MKHVRSYILGGSAIADPAGDERVHALKMHLVECSKFRRIGLRRLDKRALVRLLGRARLLKRAAFRQSGLPSRSLGGLHRSVNNNCQARKRLRSRIYVCWITGTPSSSGSLEFDSTPSGNTLITVARRGAGVAVGFENLELTGGGIESRMFEL